MTDLISRSAALAMMDKYIDMASEDDQMHHAMCVVAEGLAELPALDVVPVVHARWISEVVTKCDWKGRLNQYYQPCSCSACHEPAFREYKFCPHCGAKMDVEDSYDPD